MDKVVITNRTALLRKYRDQVPGIELALENLKKADRARGLETTLVAVDDASAMGRLGLVPVGDETDQRQMSEAVDAVYRAFSPDYLLLLGGPDVIPHQELKNPLFPVYEDSSTKVYDPDEFIPSDLPYACEVPYSRVVHEFIGPTRVVGRLPDITGSNDADYLIRAIESAASAKATHREEYKSYFGITATRWARSTALSLTRLFGSSKDLQGSPSDGPEWHKDLLSRRVHFINCHGADIDWRFYGDPGEFPCAHDSGYVGGKVSRGTIAAVECCYGAQLFAPSAITLQNVPVANAYLRDGAYGYFGSTNTSYGPADSNDYADVLCRFFLQNVLNGASLGRATLEARQDFIQSAGLLDPVHLKTLAQFVLLGDPSVQVITSDDVEGDLKLAKAVLGVGIAGVKSGTLMEEPTESVFEDLDRTERRRRLFAKGLQLAQEQPVVESSSMVKAPSEVAIKLKDVFAQANVKAGAVMAFTVDSARSPVLLPRELALKAPVAKEVYVAFGRDPMEGASKFHRTTLMIAKGLNQKVLSVRQIYSKGRIM